MNKILKPNFIIIGAMKAATTSLYTYLKQHPEIFMPQIKEPMFFNNLNVNNKIILKGKEKRKIKTFQEYYKLFDSVKKECALGEASPGYMYNKDCAHLIKKHLGNIKIISVLRQPTERAYSNYLHARRAGKEPIKDFKTAIDEESLRIKENWSPLYHYKNQGYYYDQLMRYYKIFPKENIKIVLFEDLTKRTEETMEEIFNFLGVHKFTAKTNKKANMSGLPKGFFGWVIMKLRYYSLIPNIELSKYLPNFMINFITKNIYYKPKKLKKEMIRKFTEKHYKEEINKLEGLINKDLTNWLG